MASGFSLSSIGSWAKSAATSFSKKSGLSGFLADPVGSVTDYVTSKAVDYAKQQAQTAIMGGSRLTGTISDQFNPQMQQVSASSARSGVPSYSNFRAGAAQIPGMRVDRIRNAYDALYNSQNLKVPNVRLAVEYTSPNIRGSSGTIALGTSDVSRQKVKTTTKSALTRL